MPRGARCHAARKRLPVDGVSARRRRTFQLLLLFVAAVLVANTIVGDRGLLVLRAARLEHRRLAGSAAALRRENDRLRTEARRLREDPRAIEEVARQELGLVEPGELVFLLNELPSIQSP